MHSFSFSSIFSALGIAVLSLSQDAFARRVFAHYMIGNALPAHLIKDIDDALSVGLDGFILNVGDPRQAFVRGSFDVMFPYAADVGFKLWISMDLWAAGDTDPKQGALDFIPLLRDYVDKQAYMRTDDDDHLPMVTTFADGGTENSTWIEWRERLQKDVSLIPDFDHTKGYWDSDPGWWAYWGDIVDGLASWESAWPYRAGYGGAYAGDVELDQKACTGAFNHSKPYMMPLSPLQYKNAYHTNIYRPGDVNMPLRMVNLLDMDPGPEYVQIITWNDGPESHYIGNLWREQNNDTDPSRYAIQKYTPHDGWQPLIGSFIKAFKAHKTSSGMLPFGKEEFTGALWYTTMLKDTVCPWNGASEYFVKPDGFKNGTETLNFAVVVPSAGYFVELYSGGEQILHAELSSGLNYGTMPGKRAGWQRMHILDSAGTIKRVAAGGQCVSDGCPDCIYNMNPQVVPLSDNTDDSGRCPKQQCGAVDIYVPPSIWVDDDPTIQCIPPCALILPPYTLASPTKIYWPPLTTTVWELVGTATITKTTTITIQAFTTTVVQFEPVIAEATDTAVQTLTPVPNLMPPWLTLTLPSTVATFSPIPIGWAGSIPQPTFYGSPHIVTIQPQPTVIITSLPAFPSLTYRSAEPKTTCVEEGRCGGYDCSLFGCPPGTSEDKSTEDDDNNDDDNNGDDSSDTNKKCGLFGCDGGCHTHGCGGMCGPGGCDTKCSLLICGGLGCRGGNCGIGGGGGAVPGGGGEDPSASSTASCSTRTTSACSKACAVSATITACSSVCSTFAACTPTASATATTTLIGGTPAPGSDLQYEHWPKDLYAEPPDYSSAASAYSSYLSEYWASVSATKTAGSAPAASGRVVVLLHVAGRTPAVDEWIVINTDAAAYDDMEGNDYPWCEYDEVSGRPYKLALEAPRNDKTGKGDFPLQLGPFSLGGPYGYCTIESNVLESTLQCDGLGRDNAECYTSRRFSNTTECNTDETYTEKLVCDFGVV